MTTSENVKLNKTTSNITDVFCDKFELLRADTARTMELLLSEFTLDEIANVNNDVFQMIFKWAQEALDHSKFSEMTLDSSKLGEVLQRRLQACSRR